MAIFYVDLRITEKFYETIYFTRIAWIIGASYKIKAGVGSLLWAL